MYVLRVACSHLMVNGLCMTTSNREVDEGGDSYHKRFISGYFLLELSLKEDSDVRPSQNDSRIPVSYEQFIVGRIPASL